MDALLREGFFGVRIEFALFALTLTGVAASHRYALRTATVGLAVILAFRLLFGELALVEHIGHEWVTLVNLFGLLTGFAVLADHFEQSQMPLLLPRWLPSRWAGAFGLLLVVWVLSGFLDNIAAAMIGATVARELFRGKLHVGYLAAIVAAANAGGAGSVLGDTTTTMMWIAGVSPLLVLKAYIGAAVAVVFFGTIASIQQTRLSPIVDDPPPNVRIDAARLAIVGAILLALLTTNLLLNALAPEVGQKVPVLALILWSGIAIGALVRAPGWHLAGRAAMGSLFLLALVMCASLMPVHALPSPTAGMTLALGFVSSIFDNIPLTKLALEQGGYDWGFLAYAVGLGGSMLWFGSSAGVAVSSVFEEARSVGRWLWHGWHVPVGFVLGYLAMLLVVAWQP